MRILSGIQPTGSLHIGNYLGAVRQWLELQAEHECLFCVVDLHALTQSQNPEEFRKAILQKVTELLAAGLNPETCTLFIQSHVREHTELAWILNTLTPMSELERMTQYKDKSQKNPENINAGLFDYPVLMAADILIYKTEAVPVGQDQTQHLELTRTLAKKFNAKFGNTFIEPKTLLSAEGAKIMSLQNPAKKMSKSDPANTAIGLFEEEDSIKGKIMTAVTDTGKEVKYDLKRKPGVSNLITIYSLFSEQPIKAIEKKFKGKGYAAFKKALGELLSDKLEPMRKKKKEIESREVYVKEILRQGANHARTLAQSTMEEVREKIGLLSF
ncbi:MAG: tryptophan--tRNA ligase [Candidatus Wildermuthbacteria bacterium]|nr:tryptophan--tRNA ligase [Candidatus Wildermuthbacteria bacterium]